MQQTRKDINNILENTIGDEAKTNASNAGDIITQFEKVKLWPSSARDLCTLAEIFDVLRDIRITRSFGSNGEKLGYIAKSVQSEIIRTKATALEAKLRHLCLPCVIKGHVLQEGQCEHGGADASVV